MSENMIEQAFAAQPEEIDCSTVAQSAQVDQLYAALVKFQSEAPTIRKGKRVSFSWTDKKSGQTRNMSYVFAPLWHIRDTLQPILAKHGLGWTQYPQSRINANGTYQVGVSTKIFHESGQWDMGPVMWMIPSDDFGNPITTPKAAGSAISYSQRYQIGPRLGVPCAEDDDGSAASGQSVKISNASSASTKPARAETSGPAADGDAPQCPDCGAPMRRRDGKRGPFWGCSTYPTCKGIVNISEPTPVEADPEKAARVREWAKLKTLAIAQGLTDTELSIWVTGLGKKTLDTPIEHIVAIQEMLSDVVADVKAWRGAGSPKHLLPTGKDFLQCGLDERRKILEEATKDPVAEGVPW